MPIGIFRKSIKTIREINVPFEEFLLSSAQARRMQQWYSLLLARDRNLSWDWTEISGSYDTFVKSLFSFPFPKHATGGSTASHDQEHLRAWVSHDREWTDSCHVILFWLILACQRNLVAGKNESTKSRDDGVQAESGTSRELLPWDQRIKVPQSSLGRTERRYKKKKTHFFLLTEQESQERGSIY